jgi:hypothetical protein
MIERIRQFFRARKWLAELREENRVLRTREWEWSNMLKARSYELKELRETLRKTRKAARAAARALAYAEADAEQTDMRLASSDEGNGGG